MLIRWTVPILFLEEIRVTIRQTHLAPRGLAATEGEEHLHVPAVPLYLCAKKPSHLRVDANKFTTHVEHVYTSLLGATDVLSVYGTLVCTACG